MPKQTQQAQPSHVRSRISTMKLCARTKKCCNKTTMSRTILDNSAETCIVALIDREAKGGDLGIFLDPPQRREAVEKRLQEANPYPVKVFSIQTAKLRKVLGEKLKSAAPPFALLDPKSRGKRGCWISYSPSDSPIEFLVNK